MLVLTQSSRHLKHAIFVWPFMLLLMPIVTSAGSVGAGPVDSDRPFEHTFTRVGDITGDGGQERISLHIRARAMNTPVVWDLTIASGAGKVLFHVSRDDTVLDPHFTEPGYVDNCEGYEACKSKYYFSDLPSRLFRVFTVLKPGQAIDPNTVIGALPNSAGLYLTKLGFPDPAVANALTRMHETLMLREHHVLSIPKSPVQDEAPMIWVPVVQQFVPFYYE